MASSVQEGDLLAGKYVVERVLAEGGMGVVVAATRVRTGGGAPREQVAIKLLLPDEAGGAGAVQRFLREGRAASKIKSEHVVRVIDVDVLDSGAPYIVMELLEGSDLSKLLDARGPLPVAEAIGHLLQICEALAEAHGIGIVHRDLKPANLFLTRDTDGGPCIKVLDFGISKVTGAVDADMTTTTKSIVGSPFYMSPEQLLSPKDVDPRADIWALGVVLHELLSGQVPFCGESMPEICSLVLHAPPPSIARLRSDVPEALRRVISKCLEKDRANRFQNVGELASALSRCLLPDVDGSGRSSTNEPTPASSVDGLAAAAKTRGRAALTIAAVAAAVGAFIVFGRAGRVERLEARTLPPMQSAAALAPVPTQVEAPVSPAATTMAAPTSTPGAVAPMHVPQRSTRPAVPPPPSQPSPPPVEDPFGEERK